MGDTVLPPREAAKYICDSCDYVNILPEGIKAVSQKLLDIARNKADELSTIRWNTHQLLPQSRDDFALNWIFVSDLLNFSFWTRPDKKYVVHYKNKYWTGYWSLCAAMWRSIEEGVDISDPHIYSQMDLGKLQHIFRSDSDQEMPLLEERLHCLQSAGKVLVEKYGGTFATLVRSCHGAIDLLNRIVNEFESFRDEVTFKGKRLAILKRAQILVADIWACFGGEGICRFSDIDQITAFADYRVPQVLVWLGAMQYNEELKELLRNDCILPYGDKMEVEIRGSTICCVDLIVDETNRLFRSYPDLGWKKLNSIIVDHFLWDLRRENERELQNVPYHKTRSIFY